MTARELEPYHVAWLAIHPHRNEAWLRAMLADGFDVHHLDGNHENNDPLNLVLIEHTDHMGLHGGRMLGRLGASKGKRRRRWFILPDGRKIALFKRERASRVAEIYRRDPENPRFRLAEAA